MKCLQDKLIEDGYMPSSTKSSGTFDKALATACGAFQLATPPLTTDGVAGPSTLAAMGIWSGKTTCTAAPVVATGRRVGRSRPGASRSPTGT